MSWLCAFLRVLTSPRRIDAHSSSARANFDFLHKDLLHSAACLLLPRRLRLPLVNQDCFAFVHSMRSRQMSRMNRRLAETIEPDSSLHLLELLSALGCLVSPLATTHTRQQLGTRLSTHFLSFHRGLAYLCIVFSLPLFLALLTFPFVPSTLSDVHRC